mmetsp:Transcript_13017/g.58743  ORF Transcript_13017/g.58743 Transcript_13017/m.58743 type:complete len:326 (-) Transcript_13017:446-1423(-)
MVAHLSVHRRSVRLVRVDQPCVQVPRVDLVNLRLDLLRYLREYLPFPLGVDLLDLLIVRHLASVHLLVGVRHQPAAVDALHDRPEHLLEPLVRLVLLLHLLSKHLAFELLAYEVLALVVLLPDHLAEFVPRQGLAVRVDLALGARVGILRGSARFVVVVVVVFVFVVFVVRRVLVFGRLAADAAESVAPLRGRRLGRGEHRGLVRGIGDTARASDRAERGIFFFVFFFVIVVVVVVGPSVDGRGGSQRVQRRIVRPRPLRVRRLLLRAAHPRARRHRPQPQPAVRAEQRSVVAAPATPHAERLAHAVLPEPQRGREAPRGDPTRV